MAYTAKAAEYFRGAGATNGEMDYFFFIFVAHLKMTGKKLVMRYIDFGQDCWDIDEHLIRRMEDLISTMI